METQYIAPKPILASDTEQNFREQHETVLPKDLLLWCAALKITVEQYNAMSDKELNLRMNNLKSKLKLKVANNLIARQKEQLDIIRARVNTEEQRIINGLMSKYRVGGGGAELLHDKSVRRNVDVLRDKSVDDPLNKTAVKGSINTAKDSVHNVLPKVLRAVRKNYNTDVWKGISEAVTNVEKIYGCDNNEKLNNFILEDCDEEHENKRDKEESRNNDRSKSNAPAVNANIFKQKKLLSLNPNQQFPRKPEIRNQIGTTPLQVPKVMNTELTLPASRDQNESAPLRLNIKRTLELSQFSSKRGSQFAEDRPQIEAAIIIQDKEIDRKQDYKKNENQIEIQSIDSYQIEGNPNERFRNSRPFQDNWIKNYINVPEIKNFSGQIRSNIVHQNQYDNSINKKFGQRDVSFTNKDDRCCYKKPLSARQNQAKEIKIIRDGDYVADILEHNRVRTKDVENSEINGNPRRNSRSRSQRRRFESIRDRLVLQNTPISGNPNHMTYTKPSRAPAGDVYRIGENIFENQDRQDNQIAGNSQRSSRPVRVIYDNKVKANTINSFDDSN